MSDQIVQNKCIAVTGATGYIGRTLIKTANQLGYQTTALSRNTFKNSSNWKRYELSMERPDIGEADVVFHLAYDSTGSLSLSDERAALEKLIVASKKRNAQLIFISSQSAKSPKGDYGYVKSELERVAADNELTIVRPGLVYGGKKPKSLALQLARISSLPILPDFGKSVMVQPLHVQDLSRMLLKIFETEKRMGTVVELGSEPIEMTEFLTMLSDARNKRTPFVAIPFSVSLTKILSLLLPQTARNSILQMFGQDLLDDDAAELGCEHLPVYVGGALSETPIRRRMLCEARAIAKSIRIPKWTSGMGRNYCRIVNKLGGKPINLSIPKLSSTARALESGLSNKHQSHPVNGRISLVAALFEATSIGNNASVRWHRSNFITAGLRLSWSLSMELLAKVRGFISRVSAIPD